MRATRVIENGRAMKRENVCLIIDAFTPETLPMSRLAEYLKPFAAMLGSEANVHFEGVFGGSAACRAFVEPQDVPKVRERVQGIPSRTAPRAAMKAYSDIDDLLVKDNAIGHVSIDGHNLIEFPGRRRAVNEVIGPVQRNTSIEGQVYSIGGKDETINIHLRNGEIELKCEVSIALARRLGPHLLGGTVRLVGHGLWNRIDGNWQMKTFSADDFIVLDDSPLHVTIGSISKAFDGIETDLAASTLLELRRE
jgi:hypothetical protein